MSFIIQQLVSPPSNATPNAAWEKPTACVRDKPINCENNKKRRFLFQNINMVKLIIYALPQAMYFLPFMMQKFNEVVWDYLAFGDQLQPFF